MIICLFLKLLFDEIDHVLIDDIIHIPLLRHY